MSEVSILLKRYSTGVIEAMSEQDSTDHWFLNSDDGDTSHSKEWQDCECVLGSNQNSYENIASTTAVWWRERKKSLEDSL